MQERLNQFSGPWLIMKIESSFTFCCYALRCLRSAGRYKHGRVNVIQEQHILVLFNRRSDKAFKRWYWCPAGAFSGPSAGLYLRLKRFCSVQCGPRKWNMFEVPGPISGPIPADALIWTTRLSADKRIQAMQNWSYYQSVLTVQVIMLRGIISFYWRERIVL